MLDIVTVAVAAVGGGGASHAAQFAVAWLKRRGEHTDHQDDLDADLNKHRDEMLVELLEAARKELALARIEAVELQIHLRRLGHFEEALAHIDALIAAKTVEARAAVERAAGLFLVRMKRLEEAYGTARNEVQIEHSAESLKDRGIIDV